MIVVAILMLVAFVGFCFYVAGVKFSLHDQAKRRAVREQFGEGDHRLDDADVREWLRSQEGRLEVMEFELGVKDR